MFAGVYLYMLIVMSVPVVVSNSFLRIMRFRRVTSILLMSHKSSLITSVSYLTKHNFAFTRSLIYVSVMKFIVKFSAYHSHDILKILVIKRVTQIS